MYLDAMRKFSLYQNGEDEPESDPIPSDPVEGGDPVSTPIPGIDRSVLPEDLRDLPEAEIKFHLSQMVSSLQNRNQNYNQLQRELEDLKNRVTAQPAKPAEPERPLEEEILDNPEKAIERVLEKKGYISRFNQLESQVGESAFNIVSSRIPGFHEYEDEVKKILDAARAPRTVEHIMGALEMAVGRRTLVEKSREARKPHTPSTPKPDAPSNKSKLPELTGLEAEIFSASGMTREDWEKHKNNDFNIEVPTS